ncbi:hypothetical protein ANCCAN_23387 [Ancylostoma caninum]|uniref:Hexosyltransferase n=1 Tax=Ancylostoma caninum TaxID=29170 RepID=A0A368FIY8_ANCCA|nr:hypothetical protein ANCCAN_23387 [Ancylostoma caninum]
MSYHPTYILAPDNDFCAKHDYLVIYVTRVNDTDRRDFFRRTLGKYANQYNFTLLFPLGLSSDSKVNEALKEEHIKWGDILQADFQDTYRNLTLKTYAYSHYVGLNCKNVRVVLRVEGDIVWKGPASK